MFWPAHCPHFLACRRFVRAVADPNPLIGLSGGADSLALVAAARAEGKDVLAVIVDHGLQEDSAEVAARAAEQATALGAGAKVVRVTVAPGNLEAQARAARYEALQALAAQDRRPLWVAHTADDQAETLVMSALRGQASAMVKKGEITRPFLGLRRADTRAACHELGLTYWDDPMNEDTSFLRVALRREVFPQIAAYAGFDPVPGLARAGQLVAEDRALLDRLADQAYREACEGESVDVGKLKKQDPAIRRRVVLTFLRAHGAAVNATILQSIEALISDWHGQGGVAVGGNSRERLEIVRKDGKLCVIARRKAQH